MFTLIIEDADGSVAGEVSFDDCDYIIGRSESSDIILPSDNVSRKHARLYAQSGRCYIEDLNSSNGVYVNGQRIHRPFEIMRSAQIKVGDYYLHVEGAGYGQPDLPPEQQVAHQQGRGAAADMGAAPMDYDGQAIYGRMVGTSGPVAGQPFDLTRPVNLVGRGKDCAITVVDPSMSRVHAKIVRTGDGELAVEDLRSSNGTYVNDTRVTNQILEHGDRVRFGNIEFILELPGMGDAEVVEVSSGGRKGLIALIVVLLLVLIGGGVTLFLYRDAIFGTDAQAAESEETEAEREKRLEREREEREEEYAAAERRIEDIIDRAEKLAARDRWADAKKTLVRGAKELDRIGRLDEEGKLNAKFASAEARLREDRRDYETFFEAFQGDQFTEAGVAYARLIKRDGPFKLVAKKKLDPKKTELLARGETLCGQQVFDKCLEYYQQAKALDPTDQEVAKKVAAIRLKMSEKKPEPAPAPEAAPQ